MSIGFGATFLLYAALMAMLIVTLFIVVVLIWMNSRIEKLAKMYDEMFQTTEIIFKRLEPNRENLPRS